MIPLLHGILAKVVFKRTPYPRGHHYSIAAPLSKAARRRRETRFYPWVETRSRVNEPITALGAPSHSAVRVPKPPPTRAHSPSSPGTEFACSTPFSLTCGVRPARQ
jgi:hypothetical protein